MDYSAFYLEYFKCVFLFLWVNNVFDVMLYTYFVLNNLLRAFLQFLK